MTPAERQYAVDNWSRVIGERDDERKRRKRGDKRISELEAEVERLTKLNEEVEGAWGRASEHDSGSACRDCGALLPADKGAK